MRTAFCVKCGYDLSGHVLGGESSSSAAAWTCPECGLAMTLAELQRARKRAALASSLAPLFMVLVGGWMFWSLQQPSGMPWKQVRDAIAWMWGVIAGGSLTSDQTFTIIMLHAPIIWFALSSIALWIGIKHLRAAGWRKRARAMAALGIIFIVLATCCWALYALIAVAMSGYQP